MPHAVVDGNVTRVLSRYYGDFTPIDTTAGKKLYSDLAAALLDREQADLYNQAIMDFGATVCLPRNPLCADCVQRDGCQALQKGLTTQLPVKEKAIRKKQRWFYYFLVETADDKVYIRQRAAKDIWAGLYEFLLHETHEPLYFDKGDIPGSAVIRQLFGRQSLTVKYISRLYRQELSHQTIQGQFITVRLQGKTPAFEGYRLVDREQLADYPFPKFINGWLQDPTPAQTLF